MICFLLSVMRDMIASAEIIAIAQKTWWAAPICGLRAALGYVLLYQIVVAPDAIVFAVAGEVVGTVLSVAIARRFKI